MQTDLPSQTVFVGQTAFADFGGGVTDLPRLASFVVTASNLASPRLADLTGRTSLVVFASEAYVGGANFPVAAVVVVATIAGLANTLQAQLAGTVRVHRARTTEVVSTDLAGLAVFGFQAGHACLGSGVAAFASVAAFVIAATGLARPSLADGTLGTGCIVRTIGTSALVTNFAAWACLGAVTQGSNAYLVFADVAQFAAAVVAASCDARARFADGAFGALSVVGAVGASAFLAHLPSGAWVAFGASLFAQTFPADLVAAAFLVAFTGSAHSLLANLTAAARLAFATQRQNALALHADQTFSTRDVRAARGANASARTSREKRKGKTHSNPNKRPYSYPTHGRPPKKG